MRILFDTNIIIPLEPQSLAGLEDMSPAVREIYRLAKSGSCEVLVHPGSRLDMKKDQNDERRVVRLAQLEKYEILPNPPQPREGWLEELDERERERGSNGWIDMYILEAVDSPLVDYLVTEDQRLQRRARRFGLGDSVLSVSSCLEMLRGLFDEVPSPPPLVSSEKVHELNRADPIFESLREDYDGFDRWLDKCAGERRDVFVVRPETDKAMAAMLIINRENSALEGNTGKTLKFCTFKVSEDWRGLRYGELLLKQAFSYLADNNYDSVFVEAFPKRETLIAFLNDFGFIDVGEKSGTGERIMVKTLVPATAPESTVTPLDFNRLYGPRVFRVEDVGTFVVPIRPTFHARLFPELAVQTDLFSGRAAFGNSIRKAYLCNATINRIAEGDLLLFYRSGDRRSVETVGICEATMRSTDPRSIARFVGRRTVFSYSEIEEMCVKPVLAIQFRQCLSFEGIPIDELMEGGVVRGAPQSISTVAKEGQEWIWRRINVLS